MIQSVIVSRDRDSFFEVQKCLTEHGVDVQWSDSAQNALSRLIEEPCELMVVDELLPDMTTGRFIEKALKTNPMMTCVVASTLDHEAFHQAYDRFGVMMQLPVIPGRKETLEMMEYLTQIYLFQAVR